MSALEIKPPKFTNNGTDVVLLVDDRVVAKFSLISANALRGELSIAIDCAHAVLKDKFK